MTDNIHNDDESHTIKDCVFWNNFLIGKQLIKNTKQAINQYMWYVLGTQRKGKGRREEDTLP